MFVREKGNLQGVAGQSVNPTFIVRFNSETGNSVTVLHVLIVL